MCILTDDVSESQLKLNTFAIHVNKGLDQTHSFIHNDTVNNIITIIISSSISIWLFWGHLKA